MMILCDKDLDPLDDPAFMAGVGVLVSKTDEYIQK